MTSLAAELECQAANQLVVLNELTVRPSSIHGLGVFTDREFARGETVLTIDDSRVVDHDHPLSSERGEYPHHCDYLAAGRTVLMAIPERYINSSCDPNTVVRTLDGVRHVVALRPIQAGDEVTYDYVINSHGGDVWTCRCGAPACRRTIPSSYFELPLADQRRLLPLLDDWFVAEHRDRIDALRRDSGAAA